MSGKAFMFVGMRGMGKSFNVKKLLSKHDKKSCLIFDPNNEYGGYYSHPPITNFIMFADAANKVENAVIVVEEATVFLNNRGFNLDFLELITRARHTNNTIILVFHSFKKVPKYLFDICNYVVILKTGDKVDYLDKEFDNPGLTAAFLKIKNAPTLKNKEGKEYSPVLLFDLYATDTYNPDHDKNSNRKPDNSKEGQNVLSE